MVMAKQQLGKQTSMAMDMHATTEEVLEAVISVWPILQLPAEDQWDKLVRCESALTVLWLAMNTEVKESPLSEATT
jgi:hypothetical protein